MTKKHKWKYRINVRNKILVLVILGISLFVSLGYAIVGSSLGISGILDITQPFVAVTVDANGGSIPATTGWEGTEVSKSKQIKYNSTYGTLPIPTREGYIFKGWKGINLLNIDSGLNSSLIDNNDGTYTIWKNNSGRFSGNIYIDAPVNTYITISWEIIDYNGTYSAPLQLNFYYKDGSTAVFGRNGNNYLITKEIDYIRIYQEGAMPVGTYTRFKNLMIVGGETSALYEPYYIENTTTVVQRQNHTLTAIWEKAEATFIAGREFNAAIKQLSGDTNGNYSTENTSITSIQRYTNVPTSVILANAVEVQKATLSNTPIYAWYNGGTIYYYSNATNPKLNQDATYMFQYLTNVTSIDINTLDSSETTTIQGLFNLNHNLGSVDLSNFNTSKMANMYAAFSDCSSMTSLDLSSFDMSIVTDTNSMLQNMSSLTSLKTPKTYPSDSTIGISLPVTLYDSSNNAYGTLNSTSPTETWLNAQ